MDLVRRNILCLIYSFDRISLYLHNVEVFSFKLCAAWSDCQENYILKSNLHHFLLYINILISYSFRVCKNESQHVYGMDAGRHLYLSLVSIIQTWWLSTTIHTHSDSEYTIQADWVIEVGNISSDISGLEPAFPPLNQTFVVS